MGAVVRVVSSLAGLMVLWCGGSAAPLAAQGLQVQGVQTLTFGNLIPGVATTVSPTDPARAGRYDFVGQSNGQLLISLSLPNALGGPAGATLPVSFGAGDAGYSATQSIGNQAAFNPNNFRVIRLSPTGRGSVFLGGRAQPAAGQRSGSYSAVVTLTVILAL